MGGGGRWVGVVGVTFIYYWLFCTRVLLRNARIFFGGMVFGEFQCEVRTSVVLFVIDGLDVCEA